jgi:pantothenate kinase type III
LDLGLREEPLEEGTEWLISSVNDENLSALNQWLQENRPQDSVRILSQRDIRMPVEVDEPEKVGLDRLCNALAATRLAKRNEPVLIVDLGSATTLDVVSGDGRFLGGAIMPGFRASAFFLQKISQGLPIVEADDLRFPAYPGRNTTAAIEAGLFWGMVGAIRQFLAFAQEGHEHALLLLTGGDAFPVLEALLNPNFSPQDDSVIAEATRVTDPSGVSCPPVANPQGAKLGAEPMPDDAFIPVSRFHEAICCPYLTLSGLAMCCK